MAWTGTTAILTAVSTGASVFLGVKTSWRSLSIAMRCVTSLPASLAIVLAVMNGANAVASKVAADESAEKQQEQQDRMIEAQNKLLTKENEVNALQKDNNGLTKENAQTSKQLAQKTDELMRWQTGGDGWVRAAIEDFSPEPSQHEIELQNTSDALLYNVRAKVYDSGVMIRMRDAVSGTTFQTPREQVLFNGIELSPHDMATVYPFQISADGPRTLLIITDTRSSHAVSSFCYVRVGTSWETSVTIVGNAGSKKIKESYVSKAFPRDVNGNPDWNKCRARSSG